MTTAMSAVGCVGAISNGPSRDIDEIRPMKFQYMLSGVSAGHGAMAVHAVNVPVTVAGMDVSPGEIIHMDENGACKFPGDKLEAVLTRVQALQKKKKPEFTHCKMRKRRRRSERSSAGIHTLRRKMRKGHSNTNTPGGDPSGGVHGRPLPQPAYGYTPSVFPASAVRDTASR